MFKKLFGQAYVREEERGGAGSYYWKKFKQEYDMIELSNEVLSITITFNYYYQSIIRWLFIAFDICAIIHVLSEFYNVSPAQNFTLEADRFEEATFSPTCFCKNGNYFAF